MLETWPKLCQFDDLHKLKFLLFIQFSSNAFKSIDDNFQKIYSLIRPVNKYSSFKYSLSPKHVMLQAYSVLLCEQEGDTKAWSACTFVELNLLHWLIMPKGLDTSSKNFDRPFEFIIELFLSRGATKRDDIDVLFNLFSDKLWTKMAVYWFIDKSYFFVTKVLKE